MATIYPLNATLRNGAGKGAARAVRRAGRVPGVIYGNKLDATLISFDPRDLVREITKPGFFTHIYEIDIGSAKERVLARDLQLDPVKDTPIHVDFMRFSSTTRLIVAVSVHFINEDKCTGLKDGGVLNIVRHEIELRCSPDNIPETLTADLTGLEIGDSIHISAISLPEGVKPTITDRDFTVATIAAPTVYTEAVVTPDADAVAAAAAEAAAAVGGDAAKKEGDEKGKD